MRLRTVILLLLLTLSLPAAAVSARWNSLQITQPDGTVFQARFQGDAFFKLMTTLDGCAISKCNDGAYHYAFFDKNGNLVPSPYRIGEPDVPQEVLVRSRDIPYPLLYRKAALRREVREPFPRPNLNRRIQMKHPLATRAGGVPRHGIILLVQFQDVRFDTPESYFDQLLNGSGTGSAKSYFNDQFNGMFDFQFTISDIITVHGNRSDYGKNGSDGADVNPEGMIREACQLADANIDFSLFDEDGDGAVDNVFVFFAGRSESDDPDKNADCIWPHAHSLSRSGGTLTLDGKKIDRYACASEIMRLNTGLYSTASIGTFCHEYTHTFGLPDFYDSDAEGSGGKSEGMWRSLALMDAGNYNDNGYTPPYFNAVERFILGLSEPVLLTEGQWRLEPVHRNGTYGIIPTDHPDECYLVECRSNEKWDAAIGGSGLIIYHLDRSDRPAGISSAFGSISAKDRWNRFNEVNADPSHQCADVVEALPGATSVVHAFWPQNGHDSFTVDTTPALFFWSGGKPEVAITDIRRDGESILFRFVGDASGRAPDAVLNKMDVFQDAAILQWSASDPDYEKEAYIRYALNGREGEEQVVLPYRKGEYACVIEGLTPRTAYAVQIYFKSSDVPGSVNQAKFTTASYYSDSYPYIVLPAAGEGRNTQGYFEKGAALPLRVFNAPEAEGVNWYFNGRRIPVQPSGYYSLEESGLLKAEVFFKDGSKDILIKTVTVQ